MTTVVSSPAATTPEPPNLPDRSYPPVHVDPLLRQGNAFYVAAHGLLHAVAAAVALGGVQPSLPMIVARGLSPTVAAGALAALAVGFLASAVLLVLGRGWRVPLTVTTMLSGAACLLTLPESAIALGVNALIGVGLLASRARR